MNIDSRGAD